MIGQTNAKIAGGADITVVEKNNAVIEKQTTSVYANTVVYSFFNQNKTKAFRVYGGYTSGNYHTYFGVYDYTPNTLTFTYNNSYDITVSSSGINGMMTTIAEDDSFVLTLKSSVLYYIPINQDYTVGEPISLDTAGSFNTSFKILSSTRFVGFYNKDIYIYKLENGALTLEKTITSSFYIQSLCCANGNICISSQDSKSSGGFSLKIINPDTENELYSEVGTFGETQYTEIAYKDGYLFCFYTGSGSSSPKDKGIGNVYSCDWTNNTFTNLNFSYIDTIHSTYVSINTYNPQLIKISNDLYMMFSFSGVFSFVFYDMVNKVTKYGYSVFSNQSSGISIGFGAGYNPSSSGCFLVEYNSQKQLAIFQYSSGTPGSTYQYLCDLYVDEDTKIQTNDKTYWLALPTTNS